MLRTSSWLSIAIVATLVLIVGVGTLAIRAGFKHERDIDSLYRQHVLATAQLADAMDALWKLRYGFPQFMVLGAPERERILADEKKWYAVIERNLKAYSAGAIETPAEVEGFTALQLLYRRYVDARPRWFELYGAGKLEEAADWRARTTTPYGVEVVAAFERQIELQKNQARDEIKSAVIAAERARLELLSVLVLLGIAALLLWGLSRHMLRSLGNLQRNAQATMNGIFGTQVVRDDQDEIKSVVIAFDELKSRFVAHSSELNLNLRRLEMQERESRLLSDLGDRLQACEDLEESFAAVRLYGPRLFPGHSGALYVLKNSRNLLLRSAAWGEAAESLRESFEPAGCWGLRRGKAHLVAEPAEDLRCAHIEHDIRNTLCVPMMAQGESLGLLYLQFSTATRDPEDTERAQRTAASAAAQIGLAIANLKLREALRQESIRDALTGLYNRRFMDESLEREVARAQRKQAPLAVIMFDIDHFKRLNDSYGHDAGDAVLQALGGLLTRQFRANDVACRYGGEEFLIVMPEIPPGPARERAEVLRLAVRELNVLHEGKSLGQVTISLGLAVLPQHGGTPAELVAAADHALYEAKKSGRDRLVMCNENAVPAPIA